MTARAGLPTIGTVKLGFPARCRADLIGAGALCAFAAVGVLPVGRVKRLTVQPA